MRSDVKPLYYTLRIACALCFIGHGAFGFITKQVWCNYFAVVGIGEATSYTLMPLVGFADVTCGMLLLFYPVRIAAAWLIVWGLATALMRPLSGEPFAEFVERAGNYGAPFILMALSGGFSLQGRWSQLLKPQEDLSKVQWKLVTVSLQVVGFALLAGHGWLNVIAKQGLIEQYAASGFQSPERIAMIVGVVEIAGAFSLLLWPVRNVVLLLLAWKVVSETQYPLFPFFEWVERAGSYAILLALWIALKNKQYTVGLFRRRYTEETANSTLAPELNRQL